MKSLILFFLLVEISRISSYNIRMPIREELLCLKNPKCGTGATERPNSYCLKKRQEDEPECKVVQVPPKETTEVAQGLNGLRNKFANDLKIGNMNYVYLDPILAKMGEKYLAICTNTPDICDEIGEEFKISNIMMFVNRSRSSIATKRPIGRVFRSWFNAAKTIHNMEDYTKADPAKVASLIVLMYPSASHFACSTSDIQEGYNVICYFYPKVPKDHFKNYSIEPEVDGCSSKSCSAERRTCSKTFGKLCGYDDPRSSRASFKDYSKMLNIILFLFELYLC